MYNSNRRKAIIQYCLERDLMGPVFYDNPAFDGSIIGVIPSQDQASGVVIYDRDKMVEELTQEYYPDILDKKKSQKLGLSKEALEEEALSEAQTDAEEWISYNTERSYGPKYMPIIMEGSIDSIMEMYGDIDDAPKTNK